MTIDLQPGDLPRVSVIMNVFNGAETLREAIESVLAQSFGRWELIVWDDRSADSSAEIVRSFRDPRIRYFIAPEKVPLGRARDQAINEARGEWLGFLDQDDVWLPRKLELQLAVADDDPDANLIYGRTVSFSRFGVERDFDHRHEFQPLPEGDIFERLFIDSCFIAMSSSLLRTAEVRGLGPIPEAIEVIPDYFLFLGLARTGRARAIQDVVCRYRLHPLNMSGLIAGRMHREVLWLIDQWAEQLEPDLADWRRKVHSTLVAIDEIRHPRSLLPGLRRLIMDGSLPYLFSRPFARSFRALRRRIRSPLWQRQVPDELSASPPRRVRIVSAPVSVTTFDGACRELAEWSEPGGTAT